MIPVYLAVSAAVYFGAVWLVTALGGSLAFTDTMILVGTVLAQFLLDNKKLENWIVWAVVNVFAIYTYASIGLPLVAFQYCFFLTNTVYGFITWNNSRKETHEAS
jgi:nicotinamide mononucleotide transporter